MQTALTQRHPRVHPTELLERFVPPRRFVGVRFETYVPDGAYPSQAGALQALRTFGEDIARPQSNGLLGRFRKAKAAEQRPARYLDGGFGVGKTHLLASLWHACPGPKSYATFEELTAFIGFVGMNPAIEMFANHRLLCIDEFELDDVANTLMVVSFLRGCLAGDMKLAVTSNTLPGKLGEQRFSASEFRREIAAISAHFDEQKIDGEDYRSVPSHAPTLDLSLPDNAIVAVDEFDELIAHLQTIHPVHYGPMLEGVDGVVVKGAHVLNAQDDALLYVQLIDKLYDACIPVRIEGCAPEETFAERYRNGGYRKKYGRAISRMGAMARESANLL